MRQRSLTLTLVAVLALSVFLPVVTAETQEQQGVATSSWPMFHYSSNLLGVNPVDTAIDASNVDQLTVKWKAQTGGAIWSAPAVANGTVFVGSDDHKVYAFDSATGAQKWAVLTNGMVRSGPAYDNGTVFVGSFDDSLYAIDASTGVVKWTVKTDGSIVFNPTVANGTVYVSSRPGGTLYAIDETTGAVKWSVHPNYATTWSSPAIVGTTVYMGWDDHKIYALDAATGHTKWSTTLGWMVRCAPSVANGVVYVGADDGRLYALSAATGTILWSAATAPPSTTPKIRATPAVANGLVYVPTAETTPMAGHLYAFDAVTGALVWVKTLNDYSESSPALANGIVYVGSEKQLYAYDAITGTRYWTSGENTMGGNVQYSDPAIADGMVLQASLDHYLYAFGIVPGQVVGAIVRVSDSGFSPKVISGFDFGKQVEFDFDGPSTHSVIDSNGLGLINSGPVAPGGSYLVTLPGAGNYTYKDGYSSATGTVKVPMDVSPPSGSSNTTFTVTWAMGPPPAGFVYDIQKKTPGGTKYFHWMWATTAPSATYVPTGGGGTYSFQARVTNSATGKHTGWGTPFSITVS
jgi:outer membrane protein assembly factor BamB